MQQDKLRDFLKFFRFHLPWFVLSAGFFAVILITGLYVSSRIPTVNQSAENQTEAELAIGLPAMGDSALVIDEPSTPKLPDEPVTPQDPLAPSSEGEPKINAVPSPSPLATVTPTALPSVPNKVIVTPEAEVTSSYTVRAGDTLWDISLKTYGNGYDYSRISRLNQLANPSQITIGQVLQLPAKEGQIASGVSIDYGDDAREQQVVTYRIVKGDSLWKVAEQQLGDPYRWVEIYQLNKAVIGSNPDLIYPDVTLVMPSRYSSPDNKSSQSESSNWTSSLLQ